MSWYDQATDYLYRTWLYVSTAKTIAIVLGIAFALLAITLFIASRTKWGQSKPLTKCVVLSVLAHVWLLMYALGTQHVLPQGRPDGSRESVAVRFEDGAAYAIDSQVSPFGFDEPLAEHSSLPEPPEDADSLADASSPANAVVPLLDLPLPEVLAELDLPAPAPASIEDLPLEPLPELPPLPEQISEPLAAEQQQTEAPLAQEFNPLAPPAGGEELLANASEPASAIANAILPSNAFQEQITAPPPTPSPQFTSTNDSPVSRPIDRVPQNASLPDEYRLRQAPNRLEIASAFGADADTEAAVSAALNWLARNQSASGGWIAGEHGAGTETMALGLNRSGTGSKADTGISGLALLAFLSAGHTHLAGDYRDTVRRGLSYLIDSQMPSGDLSGRNQIGNDYAVLNARMYCHGIATLALAESFAMTQDRNLLEALSRAAQFTINAQDERGGWRYRPRMGGDLSQFGWQAMALKSGERAGIAIPRAVKLRMEQFLASCAAGQHGGLATYLPGQGHPSETMTAEALACRLLLRSPPSLAARTEAVSAILDNLPGKTEDNVYYWYYATLALYQLQDESWQIWNQALKARLLSTQLAAYETNAGSWAPDSMWGGYGGRVYSTAMSCMCLEVYYRFLPMYQHSNLARSREEPIR